MGGKPPAAQDSDEESACMGRGNRTQANERLDQPMDKHAVAHQQVETLGESGIGYTEHGRRKRVQEISEKAQAETVYTRESDNSARYELIRSQRASGILHSKNGDVRVGEVIRTAHLHILKRVRITTKG